MAIVSSQITYNHGKGSGLIRVHEEHMDHVGVIHSHRYTADVGMDVDANLATYAANFPMMMLAPEKERIENEIMEGENPNTVSSEWLTNRLKLRCILRAFMEMGPEPVILVPTLLPFINNITDAQLDNAFSVTVRNRIRARAIHVTSLKSGLDTDILMREEL